MPLFSHSSRPDFSELSGLEERLNHTFSPIDPDPGFVQQLGYRLSNPAEVTLEEPRKRFVLAIIIAAFGLFSGAFLFWFLRLLSGWLSSQKEQPA